MIQVIHKANLASIFMHLTNMQLSQVIYIGNFYNITFLILCDKILNIDS